MKSIQLFLLCSFLFFIEKNNLNAQDTTLTFQLSIPIQSGIDDVEELSNGGIYVESTDLELIEDDGEQLVGLHFRNVDLSPTSNISQAYIQFRTDEVSTGDCNLQIFGEKTGDANNFSNNFFELTNRNKTIAFVDWSPVEWLIEDERSAKQRTPDLINILQEIIAHPEWERGNNLSFFIDGEGQRTAHAYEGEPDFVAELVVEFSETFAVDDLSNIYINELMAKNNSVLDEYGESDDWLEIFNGGDSGVMLDNIFISDDPLDTTKYQIPEPIFLYPNGFTILWLDDAPEQGNQHIPFKLSSGGETVLLSQLQGEELVVLDQVTFDTLAENVSYGRLTDGEEPWVNFAEVSPNASNNGNALYFDATVNFSLESGYYSSGATVSLMASDPLSEIRYTTDGSIPDDNSTIYNNPITLNETMLVKAKAFKPDFETTSINEAFYLINGSHELPVVQISVDPKYLFDNQEGMYVTGNNGITGNCSDEIERNWNQDWERPISIQYFETDGEEAFKVNAGMKIGGGCSRGFSQKMFNIFLRGSEYGDSKVEYPLFKNLDIDEYKRFKLRSSGNDFPLTKIRDATIHEMLRDQIDIDVMGYEPVVVYLNGEYWGFMGIREFFGKHHINEHFDVDKDSLDIIKNPYTWFEVKEGSKNDWDVLTNFIRSNSLENLINYDYVVSQIDIYEFMNYHIAQMYVANYDFPANNVMVWREQNNGKWRWMLFDTDISSGYGLWSPATSDFNAITHGTTAFGPFWPNGESSTLFFRKIIQNQYFQNEFVQRSCTVGQVTFGPDRAAHFIDSLSQLVSSEVEPTINKFGNAPASWKMWQDDPMGGSFFQWQNRLDDFKDFFEERMDRVLVHYQSYFGYEGNFALKINFDEMTNGTVVFHQNDMKIPFGYEGKYFSNVPIRIKAIPKEGYYFLHWEETAETTPIINFTSNIDAELTPIFLENGTTPTADLNSQTFLEVAPIPARNTLNLEIRTSNTTESNIRIYNVMGEEFYNQNLTLGRTSQTHSIDIAEWGSGIYFLKTRIGGEEIVRKIVVE